MTHGAFIPSVFQSTLSMRRAIRFLSNEVNSFSISIHALHEESDKTGFLSDRSIEISIHALHEESDNGDFMDKANRIHFNPRSP